MKYFFILVSIFALLICKEEVYEDIPIDIYSYDQEYEIGKENGIFTLESSDKFNDTFNPDDIEQLTKFDLELTGNQSDNNYTLNCRLWLDYRDKVIVLCNFNESLKTNEIIDSASIQKTVIYKTYNLNLKMEISNIKLIKLDYNVPFLYSAIDINVDDNLKIISFQLNIDSYNNEQLYISNSKYKVANLDNCTRESNLLNCEIPKENFDLIANTENECGIGYLPENGKWEGFDFAIVNINYTGYTKEDIYINLEKIQEKNVDRESFIAATTNITDLPNLKTEYFRLEITSQIRPRCYFIKHDKSTPLYLTCYASDTYEGIIEEIKGVTLNDIHYKYNFIIA